MIGKIPDKRKDGKSSFRELVSYCKDAPAQAAHVGFQYLLSPESAAIEMEALSLENRRCKDPVFHAILSWRENELPTNQQVDALEGTGTGQEQRPDGLGRIHGEFEGEGGGDRDKGVDLRPSLRVPMPAYRNDTDNRITRIYQFCKKVLTEAISSSGAKQRFICLRISAIASSNVRRSFSDKSRFRSQEIASAAHLKHWAAISEEGVFPPVKYNKSSCLL